MLSGFFTRGSCAGRDRQTKTTETDIGDGPKNTIPDLSPLSSSGGAPARPGPARRFHRSSRRPSRAATGTRCPDCEIAQKRL